METVLVIVGLFGAMILLVAGAVLWMGFWKALALSTLWAWFVVPIFALPGITLMQAYALTLVVASFQGLKKPDDNKDARNNLNSNFAWIIFAPPVACGTLVGIGWCVKTWLL